MGSHDFHCLREWILHLPQASEVCSCGGNYNKHTNCVVKQGIPPKCLRSHAMKRATYVSAARNILCFGSKPSNLRFQKQGSSKEAQMCKCVGTPGTCISCRCNGESTIRTCSTWRPKGHQCLSMEWNICNFVARKQRYTLGEGEGMFFDEETRLSSQTTAHRRFSKVPLLVKQRLMSVINLRSLSKSAAVVPRAARTVIFVRLL